MAALNTYRCATCGHAVRAREAVEVLHPCPQRRTKAGQKRMTQLVKEDNA